MKLKMGDCMKKAILCFGILILIVSLLGCLSSNENIDKEMIENNTPPEDIETQPEDANEISASLDDTFGIYKGYDFTDEEVAGLWQNIERSTDDMIFFADHTFRYQLDTDPHGGGWILFQWYEGTWRIEDGCVLISLNGQFGHFEDFWKFTKNEDGTMNCMDGKIFEKSKPIVAY